MSDAEISSLYLRKNIRQIADERARFAHRLALAALKIRSLVVKFGASCREFCSARIASSRTRFASPYRSITERQR
jgi:hypothetical protein